MKILVVGGGIAGMTAAVLLRRQGNDVRIVDTAPEYRHIGFGIYLWNFGRQVLDELGIGQKVMDKAWLVPGTALQNTRYETLFYLSYAEHGRHRPVSVYRADLHQNLRDAAAGIPVRFNTTFTSLEQDADGVTVRFSDDTADRFDMVIGADGVRSKVRAVAFGDPQVRPYGWRAYAFWGDGWKRKSEGVQIVSAPGCGLAMVPLHDRHFAGVNVFCPPGESDPVETRHARLHAYMHAFGRDVHDLIDSVDPAEIYRTDLMYVPMGPWSAGRIVLIGDARHAMSPIAGRGANVALEDGSALAHALEGVRSQGVPDAFRRFGAERTVRVERLRKSLYNTVDRFALIQRPLVHAARNAFLRMLPEPLFAYRKPDPSLT